MTDMNLHTMGARSWALREKMVPAREDHSLGMHLLTGLNDGRWITTG